jgi:hypothetical protein
MDVIELLRQIFGTDGTGHPLFRKLGLDPALFERSVQLMQSLRSGPARELTDEERNILLTVPVLITAEEIGPAFSDDMKADVLELRSGNALKVGDVLSDLYVPLDPERISPGLSVLENVLFAKISGSAGARADDLRRIVIQVLEAEGLKHKVIELIFDLGMSLNGANLASVFAEPLAVSRAAIKRPDILVLDQILSSFEQKIRVRMHKNLRALMPRTTLIYLADAFDDPGRFDVFMEIRQGRMVSAEEEAVSEAETALSADLQRKVRALEATEMFSGLSRRQLRLLAFGSKWYSASEGEVVFRQHDDPGDGAYMILSGTASLFKPAADGTETFVATVGSGNLVGELGLIRKVPRALTMRADSEFRALRLGAQEFLDVVENDAALSFKLLQVVAGYAS